MKVELITVSCGSQGVQGQRLVVAVMSYSAEHCLTAAEATCLHCSSVQQGWCTALVRLLLLPAFHSLNLVCLSNLLLQASMNYKSSLLSQRSWILLLTTKESGWHTMFLLVNHHWHLSLHSLWILPNPGSFYIILSLVSDQSPLASSLENCQH